MSDIQKYSVKMLADRIRKRELTCVAVATEFLSAIERNKHLNAVIYCNPDQVLEEAALMDKEADAGEFRGPLHGVPLGVKDNIHIKGVPNTAGCLALKNFVPSEDAPIIKKLREAGALFIAKLNMHELAFGVTSDNKAFGRVGNPHDPQYIAGGSSGGTGAAIGAYMIPAGLGSDTGGSIRIPASINGIYGLRPSSGRYSREGITPITYLRDTAGPMGNTIEDIIILDEIITGQKFEHKLESLKGIRLGISNDCLAANLQPDIEESFNYAKARLQEEGVVFVDIQFNHLNKIDREHGACIFYYGALLDLPDYFNKNQINLTLEELASQIASPDVLSDFEDCILSGLFTKEMYDHAVNVVRPKFIESFREIFNLHNIDAIISPTTACSAVKFEEINEKVQYDLLRNARTITLAGFPSLSIPIVGDPKSLSKMPAGLMIDGSENADQHVLSIGYLISKLFQNYQQN